MELMQYPAPDCRAWQVGTLTGAARTCNWRDLYFARFRDRVRAEPTTVVLAKDFVSMMDGCANGDPLLEFDLNLGVSPCIKIRPIPVTGASGGRS